MGGSKRLGAFSANLGLQLVTTWHARKHEAEAEETLNGKAWLYGWDPEHERPFRVCIGGKTGKDFGDVRVDPEADDQDGLKGIFTDSYVDLNSTFERACKLMA